MELNFDAVIVGAGPAGSSAAILLAKHGWRIALIEKQNFPRPKVCGECIAASNLPLLDELGVGDAVSQLAGPSLKHLTLINGAHSVKTELPRYSHHKYSWGRALNREHLDMLLLERAKQNGAEIFQPWSVNNITGEPGNFMCHAHASRSNNKLVMTTPVIIAAHGCWQPAPGKSKPAPHPSDLLAFKATFEGGSLPDETLTMLSFPGGYGGMVMSGHNQLTLAFCVRRDVLAACRLATPETSAAQAAQIYVSNVCPAVAHAIHNAQLQGKWLTIGPLQPGIRLPRQGSKLFLIGNAAGEAHPIIGEGISMAIQSAFLLASNLAMHKQMSKVDQKQVQKKYAAAWHRHFSKRIQLASLFANLSMRPKLAQYVFPVVNRYPQLLTYAALWSGKTRAIPLSNMNASIPNPKSAPQFFNTRPSQGGG